MRLLRAVPLSVLAFAAGAASAGAATAGTPKTPVGTSYAWTQPPAALAFTAPVLHVKTARMLVGSGYPWVQPVWTVRDALVLPTLPAMQSAAPSVQPPASIPITAPVERTTLAVLPGASYPWVQPVWAVRGSFTFPRLPGAYPNLTWTQPPAGIPAA